MSRAPGRTATFQMSATHPPVAGPIVGKILICVTEDWFALSHFQPLIRRLVRLSREVVVATRSSGRMDEIEALGARTIELDYNRSSMNPVRETKTIGRLAVILRSERPDVVHLIAMKPIVLGGMALGLGAVRSNGRSEHRPHAVVHMTGLGFLAISDTPKARAARRIALAIMRRTLNRPSSWLLVENPEDQAFLEAGGIAAGERSTMLGGAGIDPEAFAVRHRSDNQPPVAAFVGRMIRSKGVAVLMEAARILEIRKVPIAIELYGDTDEGNPEALSKAVLELWSDGVRMRFMGFTRDVAAVWHRADIFVLPAISREGMPRSLLEAAAAGRPLLVTDVPGCRHFVSDGIEGFVVPPGDAVALADRLEALAGDASLRARLGAAARAKVLDGYTEDQVEQAIEQAYRRMLGGRGNN